jgi:DedD protein
MRESNELNDIILNKGGSSNNNKKIILAVATLGVILIIVVMLMNSLTSTGTDNLPQTPIPPEPNAQLKKEMKEEPLFEEVKVIQEDAKTEDNLDAIAKKLKEESQAIESAEPEVIDEPIVPQSKPEPEPVVEAKPAPVAKPAPKQVTTPKAPVAESSGSYYIQVGSFSKFAPNEKFLNSITSLGYQYKFHKVKKNGNDINKVLVGPFKTSTAAKDARRVLRAKVEPGAFLVQL